MSTARLPFLSALILLLSSSLLAQPSTAPSLKGHHLGETVREFLVASPVLLRRLELCSDRARNPDILSGMMGLFEETQTLADPGDDSLAVPVSTGCGSLLRISFEDPDASFRITNAVTSADVEALHGKLKDLSKNTQASGMANVLGGDKSTSDMMRMLSGGDSSSNMADAITNLIKSNQNLEFAGSVVFRHGHLDAITLFVYQPWEVVSIDLQHKYGRDSTHDTFAAQNGYGARFSLHEATWQKPGYLVEATESIYQMQRLVRITMLSGERRQRQQQAIENRKSTLD